MLASWYGPGFDGRNTSTREIFDAHRFTAASHALPLGSYARVMNLDNGQSVVVRVTIAVGTYADAESIFRKRWRSASDSGARESHAFE